MKKKLVALALITLAANNVAIAPPQNQPEKVHKAIAFFIEHVETLLKTNELHEPSTSSALRRMTTFLKTPSLPEDPELHSQATHLHKYLHAKANGHF